MTHSKPEMSLNFFIHGLVPVALNEKARLTWSKHVKGGLGVLFAFFALPWQPQSGFLQIAITT